MVPDVSLVARPATDSVLTNHARHSAQDERTLQPLSSSLRFNFTIQVAALFYTVLVLFAWICTCILCYRPLNFPYWPTGSTDGACYFQVEYMEGEFIFCGEPPMTAAMVVAHNRWRVAVRTVSDISAVLAVPLTSAICARAAVVYMQASRRITLRQTLELADRSWFALSTPQHLIRKLRAGGTLSWFLAASMSLCMIGSAVWPLQGILITQESVTIYAGGAGDVLPTLLALDADITALSQGPTALIINDVAESLAFGSSSDDQPHLWQDPKYDCGAHSALWWQQCNYSYINSTEYVTWQPHLVGRGHFVSVLDNNLETSMAINHGFRLNSSISCETISDSEYHQGCASGNSFVALDQNELPDSSDFFEFCVCVPGNTSLFPWDMTTRNRQDISEAIYFHINTAGAQYLWGNTSTTGVSVRCDGVTTAGYFELPSSHQQNLTFGPLLQTFDLAASIDAKTDIQMYIAEWPPWTDRGGIVLGESNALPNVSSTPTLGPLVTSAIALFGPGTWFSLRANSSAKTSMLSPNGSIPFENCSTVNIVPFRELFGILPYDNSEPIALPRCTSKETSYFSGDLLVWLETYFFSPPDAYPNITERIETALTISTFYANEASLHQAAATPPWRRPIFKSVGQDVQKLSASTWAIYFISALVALYLAGLWLMAWYACSAPTWTNTLDAFAMIRVGVSLVEQNVTGIPSLTRVDASNLNVLDEADGWLGEENDLQDYVNATPMEDVPRRTRIGGQGELRRDAQYSLFGENHASPKIKKDENVWGMAKRYWGKVKRSPTSPITPDELLESRGILMKPYNTTIPGSDAPRILLDLNEHSSILSGFRTSSSFEENTCTPCPGTSTLP